MKWVQNTGIIMRGATINHLTIIKSFVSYFGNWFEYSFFFRRRSLWFQLLKASFFRFLYLTLNWIWIFGLWTFDILYFGKHWWTFSTIFGHFIQQTTYCFFRKITDRLIKPMKINTWIQYSNKSMTWCNTTMNVETNWLSGQDVMLAENVSATTDTSKVDICRNVHSNT